MTETQTNPEIGDKGIIKIRVPDGDGPHPFLVGIHGGGWENGDRHSYDWCWPRLQPLNAGLVQCSHRPASVAPCPAAYDDLVHVLRWLYDHAAEHRLDRERCALYGCSSGGHLVSLLGTRATVEESRIPKIRALVPYAAVTDLASWYHELQELAPGSTAADEFMRAAPEAAPEAYRRISPINNIHDGVPPALFIHGDEDEIIPVSQARRMVAALEAAGHRPRLLEVEGTGHFGMNGSLPGEDKRFIHEPEVLEFLRQHLDL